MPWKKTEHEREYHRRWRAANRERDRGYGRKRAAKPEVQEYQRQWKRKAYAKDPEKARANSRKHYARHAEKRRIAARGGNAGLTPAQYNELLAISGGICAICRTIPRKINVDHDHKTGKVRGILCTCLLYTSPSPRDS